MTKVAKVHRVGSIIVEDEDQGLGNLVIRMSHTPDWKMKIERADRWDLLAAVMAAQGQAPFDKRCADAMADAIDFMVRTKLIDSRSPAADALLSYREGKPSTERSDQLVELAKDRDGYRSLYESMRQNRDECVSESAALETRNAELRTALAKLSREAPYPDEIKNWTEQRGKLVAEIGTLKARTAELEARIAFALENEVAQERSAKEEQRSVNRVLKADLDYFRGETRRIVGVCRDKNLRITALGRELADREATVIKLRTQHAKEEDAKNTAYNERNRLVVALAHMALGRYYDDYDRQALTSMAYKGWFAGIGRHQPDPDPNWDPQWLTVVFIDTPAGQLSWHMHDRDKPLLDGLPMYRRPWDGHTTEEKYQRIESLFHATELAKVPT